MGQENTIKDSISDGKTWFCPNCASDNVVIMKRTGLTIMLSFLLFALPLPIFKKRFYCFDCEHEWKKDKDL